MSSSSGLRPHPDNGASLSSQAVRFEPDVKPRKNFRHRPLRPKSKAAPATNYPIERSSSLAYCLLGVWFLGACVSLFWVFNSSFTTESARLSAAGTLVCMLLSGGGAYWGWAHVQPGLLRWDGKVWQIEAPGGATESQPARVGTLSVQFDFQFLLLVRLDEAADVASGKAGGSSRWLWLDQSSQSPQWLALRRAVFSPKPPRVGSPNPDTALAAAGDV